MIDSAITASFSLLFVGIIRLIGVLVATDLFRQKRQSRYMALVLAWVLGLIGTIIGIITLSNGNATLPGLFDYIFSVLAGLGTLLFVAVALSYYYQVNFKRIIAVILSLGVVTIVPALLTQDLIFRQFGLVIQAGILIFLMIVCLMRRNIVIQHSGASSYYWLLVLTVMTALHAIGFLFFYPTQEWGVAFFASGILYILVIIYFLHLEYGVSSIQLLRGEERFRQIADNVNEVFYVRNLNTGSYEYVSPIFNSVFGVNRENLIINSNYVIDNVVHPDDREMVKAAAKKQLEDGILFHEEYRILRPDGVCRWIRIREFFAETSRDNTKRVVGIAEDITERKQMEEALRKYSEHLEELVAERTSELKDAQENLLRSERLATLGQFSGSISHELRNPLGVIDSSAYYLKKRLKDADEKVLEHLARIESSVSNSTAIIESLLNLTRMKEPQLEKLNLADVSSDAISTAKVPASVKVIEDFPVQELMVKADREQLRMTLKNIIKNAVEAMDDEGVLTVTIRVTDDGLAEISFSDTGPGIAPENLKKVFQPLFSTRAKGIGFGLSICKMIIDKHGGTITAESEPGKGATIIILLPLYADKHKKV